MNNLRIVGLIFTKFGAHVTLFVTGLNISSPSAINIHVTDCQICEVGI
jgi:hypothetical protein